MSSYIQTATENRVHVYCMPIPIITIHISELYMVSFFLTVDIVYMKYSNTTNPIPTCRKSKRSYCNSCFGVRVSFVHILSGDNNVLFWHQ